MKAFHKNAIMLNNMHKQLIVHIHYCFFVLKLKRLQSQATHGPGTLKRCTHIRCLPESTGVPCEMKSICTQLHAIM